MACLYPPHVCLADEEQRQACYHIEDPLQCCAIIVARTCNSSVRGAELQVDYRKQACAQRFAARASAKWFAKACLRSGMWVKAQVQGGPLARLPKWVIPTFVHSNPPFVCPHLWVPPHVPVRWPAAAAPVQCVPEAHAAAPADALVLVPEGPTVVEGVLR